MESLLAASAPVNYTPFYILAAGVVFVLVTIIKLRLHPFLGLTLGAILVGLLTPSLPGVPSRDQSAFKGSLVKENKHFGEQPQAPAVHQELLAQRAGSICWSLPKRSTAGAPRVHTLQT